MDDELAVAEKPVAPDFLFAIAIQPIFNVAQNGINVDAQSEFPVIVSTAEISYKDLLAFDDQRLTQHVTGEVVTIVNGLIHQFKFNFGETLAEHLTGAFVAARKIARERAASSNGELQKQDDSLSEEK